MWQDHTAVKRVIPDLSGPPPSTLLCLPLEIRDHILELVFFDFQLRDLCKCHRPNPFQRERYGVLLANHQLYKESSDVVSRGAVLQLALFPRVPGNGAVVALEISPYWTWRTGSLWEANEHKRPDSGWEPTSLELLRRWPRLSLIRHIHVRIPSANRPFDQIPLRGCTDIAELLNEPLVIESVIVSASIHPAAEIQELAEPLRETCNAKGAAFSVEDGHGRCQFYDI